MNGSPGLRLGPLSPASLRDLRVLGGSIWAFYGVALVTADKLVATAGTEIVELILVARGFGTSLPVG